VTATLTVASSATPLNCVLDPVDVVAQISVVQYKDPAGKIKPITVAADGRRFQFPIDAPGTYEINVTMKDQVPAAVVIVEDCDDRTQLLTILDKTGNFRLRVTA
jgi:hypothetical protein